MLRKGSANIANCIEIFLYFQIDSFSTKKSSSSSSCLMKNSCPPCYINLNKQILIITSLKVSKTSDR